MSEQLNGLLDRAMQSSSEALAAPVQQEMSSRFSFDFGHVRVHRDSEAARASELLGARAFTMGSHIVFGDGTYAPETPEGKGLLAHELTHVVQQRGASGLPQAKEVGEPGDAMEAEADAAATAVLRGENASVQLSTTAMKPQGGLIGCMWHMWRFSSLIDSCSNEFQRRCGEDLLTDDCQEFMDGAGYPSDAVLKCVGRKNPEAMAKLLSSCSTVSLGRILGGVSRGMGLKASIDDAGGSGDAVADAGSSADGPGEPGQDDGGANAMT
jgi:hypothetical protein